MTQPCYFLCRNATCELHVWATIVHVGYLRQNRLCKKVRTRFQHKVQHVAVPNTEIRHVIVNTFRQIGRYWTNTVPNQHADCLMKKNVMNSELRLNISPLINLDAFSRRTRFLVPDSNLQVYSVWVNKLQLVNVNVLRIPDESQGQKGPFFWHLLWSRWCFFVIYCTFGLSNVLLARKWAKILTDENFVSLPLDWSNDFR